MKEYCGFLFIVASFWCFINNSVYAQNLRPQANEKGKFGYVDENGEEVISFKYAEAYPFEEGLAKVKKGNKYGFIDPDGKSVGKIKYTLILPFTGSYCRVAVGGSYKEGVLKDAKWGFLNKRGEEILLPEYDEIGEFEDGFTYVVKGKKYGLIDEHAKFLLEPKYTAVGLFDKFGNCWFAVSGKIDKKTGKLLNAKYGIINKEGKIIIPAKYNSLGYFYKYKTKNSLGMIDCPASSSDAFSTYALQRPLSRLYDPGHYYNIMLSSLRDKQSIDSLKTAMKNTEFFIDANYLFFRKGAEKYGVFNDLGEVLIPEKDFNVVYCPSSGVALVAKMKRKVLNYGYYNVESGYLKTFDKDEILSSYTDGLGRIQNKNDNSVYFVDKSGNRVTDVFRLAMNFDNGLCIVQDNGSGKFGVINNEGKNVIPFEYDNIKAAFRDNYIGVCKSDKWGFVDQEGKVVIPLVYDSVTDFEYGFAGAQANDKMWGMINKENNEIIPFMWNDFKLVEQNDPTFVWGKKEDLWYCYDINKKTLAFPAGFEDVANFKDGFANVKQGGKYGMINTNGDFVVPCLIDNYECLKNALDYMKGLGKTSLNETDAFRLNIYGDNTVNEYEITDKIPNEKWDY